jgi:TNF receptor-associated factor 4
VGTVGTLEEHVATCGFTLVPCPKQCKEYFMRKDTGTHLENDCRNRDYKCKYCGMTGLYARITGAHERICRCKFKIQQFRVNPHTMMACKYKGIGCAAETKRKDMAAHEQDDQLHLHMALETVNMQRSVLNSLQVRVASLEGKFVLSDYQKKKETGELFQFPPFYTHPNGYHMALRVYAGGELEHVSVRALTLRGEHDAELKWPFIGTVTFKLLNQLEDKNHYSRTLAFNATRDARVGSIGSIVRFIPYCALAHDPVRNIQYLKDDTLHFEMLVEVADHMHEL